MMLVLLRLSHKSIASRCRTIWTNIIDPVRSLLASQDIDHEQVIKEAERIFSDWEPRAHPRWKESLPPRDTLPVAMIRKETEQTNVCLATLGASYSSPDYY